MMMLRMAWNALSTIGRSPFYHRHFEVTITDHSEFVISFNSERQVMRKIGRFRPKGWV